MPALPENTRSRTIYHTSYTHSISLTELEHVPKALICVGETGIIEWIEKDIADDGVERVLADHGLRIGDVEVIKIDEGGIVPGLIDTHTVRRASKQRKVGWADM
jgi:guanine deaminase